MPDGLTHERFRRKGRIFAYPFSVIFPIIVPVHGLGMYEWETFAFGLGLWIGYDIVGRFCTPDWDIVAMTKDEGRMLNEIWIVGPVLVGVSTIYGGYFRRHHRSFITHFPFVSTSIRYLLVFWYPLLEIIRHKSVWGAYLMVGMFIGTSLSDLIHWYLDMIKYPKSE